MDLKRLLRLPSRVIDDLKIIKLVENWRDVLQAKSRHDSVLSIKLRNGVVLNSPKEVSLNFLFHEIWIDEFYAPRGYAIKADETIVDIGANIGVFAVWAATRAHNVKVKSYEPFPQNSEYFRSNVKESSLKNIEFHSVAVADEIGVRTLKVENSWILHSLTDRNADGTGIEVECVSLDSILSEVKRCDFLKLDCEGGEYEILYAASDDTLNKVKRIVCEFNVLDRLNNNGEALSAFLLDKGYFVDEIRMLEGECGLICAKRFV